MISIRRLFLFLLILASVRARAEQAGAIDLSFNAGAGANGPIDSLVAYPDDHVLVSGRFTAWNDEPAAACVRLLSDGSRDSTFNSPAGVGTLSQTRVWLQPDGRILIAGSFSNLAGAPRSNLGRLLATGELDSSFRADTDGQVADVAQLAGGKLLIVGQFQTVNGIPKLRAARLLADGAVDETFDPVPSPGFALSVALLPSGQFLVPGFSADPIYGMLRLNEDGSLDDRLNFGSTSVNRAFPDADGNLIMDVTFNPSRLMANDMLDAKFVNGTGSTLARMAAVQPDGRILAVGSGLRDATGASSRMVRLFADGKIDPSFRTSLSTAPSVTAVGKDGRILIAGPFDPQDTLAYKVIALHGNDVSAPAEILWSAGDLGAAHTGFVTLKAMRQGNLDGSASASWSAAFTPAEVQITPASGQIQFLPGQRHADVRLEISARPEAATEIAVSLADFAGATAGANTLLTLYLANQTGAVQLTAAAASVEEVSGRTLIGLRRTGALSRSASVRWRAVGENPERDLSPTSGFASFPIGRETASVIFNINDDRDVEANRTYAIEIESEDADWTIDGSRTTGLEVLENDLPGLPGPGADGSVFRLLALSDGGVLMGGQFSFVNGLERPRVARLNAHRRLVEEFHAPAVILNGLGPAEMFEQADGKIVVFGRYFGTTGEELNVVRLNRNGSLDETFDSEDLPYIAQGADSANGFLLFGTSANRTLEGVYQGSIVRTDRSGRLDETFATFTAGWGTPGIVPLANGQFYTYGNIVAHTAPYRAGDALPVPFRAGLMRINADGTVDASFNVTLPGANVATTNFTAGPSRVQLDGQGRLNIGGAFATVNNIAVPGFARLSPAGEVDTAFNDNLRRTLPFAAPLVDFTIVPDGKALLVTGSVQTRYSAHFVGTDGIVRRSFSLGPAQPNLRLATLRDGLIFVGGPFVTIDSQARYRYAVFNADGVLQSHPSPVIESLSRANQRTTLRITSRTSATAPLQRSANATEWDRVRDVQLIPGEQFIEVDDAEPKAIYKLAP